MPHVTIFTNAQASEPRTQVLNSGRLLVAADLDGATLQGKDADGWRRLADVATRAAELLDEHAVKNAAEVSA